MRLRILQKLQNEDMQRVGIKFTHKNIKELYQSTELLLMVEVMIAAECLIFKCQ